MNWTKLLLLGRASRLIPDGVRCVLHIRSETRCICKFCIVLLHNDSWFEKYHSVNAKTVYLPILQYWVQECHLYVEIVRIL